MIRQLLHRLATRLANATVAPPSCQLPPEGWWCSRRAGHDGPCAARPIVYRKPEEYFELPEGVGIREPEPPIGEPPQGLLDLVPAGKAFDGMDGSTADVVFDDLVLPPRTIAYEIPVELHVPMTPAEVKKYPHLARAFANERKPVDQAGSPTGKPPDLAGAIAARTEAGGPGDRTPRKKEEVDAIIADVRSQGKPGKGKKRCPDCAVITGASTKLCPECGHPFRRKGLETVVELRRRVGGSE